MDELMEKLLDAALEWQDAVDLLVASAPLPQDHPATKLIVERASAAHMNLLHVTRECRLARQP
jgi:hypothetical protein